MKVIITGVTGMVGEGVMFECLENPTISEILIVGRRTYGLTHPKLRELIVKDFSEIKNHSEIIKQYNACFFCAGVSSIGENEESFARKTYDFVVSEIDPSMTFIYVSGNRTDSTEQGRKGNVGKSKRPNRKRVDEIAIQRSIQFPSRDNDGHQRTKKRKDIVQNNGTVNLTFYFSKNFEAFRSRKSYDQCRN